MQILVPVLAQSNPVETRQRGRGATGDVAMLLRLEGAAEMVLAILAYRHLGGTWPLFAALFLTPDISMLGYFIDRRVGARLYNLGHTYISPALLAAAGLSLAMPLLYTAAAIWAAHIGFDRLMGYGLKYPTHFGATHLRWKNAPGDHP
jgi:predicted benzoate:H+ symporter BenE